MAAALGTWTAVSQSKPKRIEGHTSNVEAPILYVQYFQGTIGETTEAGDTYIIPHKFTNVKMIKAMPHAAVGATLLNGGEAAAADDGVYYSTAATITGPTQITTAATAGASTVVCTSGSAINDVYNNCWLKITFDNGNEQVVKITDYVGATTTATLADPLAQDIAATGSYYTVLGTLMTVSGVAATPTLSFEIIGTFE